MIKKVEIDGKTVEIDISAEVEEARTKGLSQGQIDGSKRLKEALGEYFGEGVAKAQSTAEVKSIVEQELSKINATPGPTLEHEKEIARVKAEAEEEKSKALQDAALRSTLVEVKSEARALGLKDDFNTLDDIKAWVGGSYTTEFYDGQLVFRDAEGNPVMDGTQVASPAYIAKQLKEKKPAAFREPKAGMGTATGFGPATQNFKAYSFSEILDKNFGKKG